MTIYCENQGHKFAPLRQVKQTQIHRKSLEVAAKPSVPDENMLERFIVDAVYCTQCGKTLTLGESGRRQVDGSMTEEEETAST